MRFDSIGDLQAAGFTGFERVQVLKSSQCRQVPASPGVYVVARDAHSPPKFIEASVGGHFKGKDPAVPIPVLQGSWVDGTAVVYIGKAGGGGSSATLRKRLQTYMRFGSGKPVGHWGGRYIWQLADHDDLLVCWQVVEPADPAVRESELIRAFTDVHGRRPFANLRD